MWARPALAPRSRRMASALHSCSRRTAVSLRQYVVCVPRYTHTWPHVRACVRARATSQRRSPHARRAGVCVYKKQPYLFQASCHVSTHITDRSRSRTSPPPTPTDAHRHTPTHNRSTHTRHNQNLYNHNDKPSHRILTWPGCLSDHQGIASRRAHRSLHFERLSGARDATLSLGDQIDIPAR